jgi:hypothetical protein
MKLDTKSIAAIAALLTALAGGVELRVQVGLLTQKVADLDNKIGRIESRLEQRSVASYEE